MAKKRRKKSSKCPEPVNTDGLEHSARSFRAALPLV